MNNPVSEKWDLELNRLLDKYEIIIIDNYTAQLNKTQIWTENYPYGFGAPYGINAGFRPRRRTILRLKKTIDEANIKTALEGSKNVK